jgi:type III restriction enzyme
MNMLLKNYQNNAVAKLMTKVTTLLSKSAGRICVLKAPTGSGKTIVVAEFLKQLSAAILPGRYAFIWISSNDLHLQSKEKVSGYLTDSRYSFLTLDEVSEERFEDNQIVFVNWESLTKQDRATGEFKNIFMKDGETGRNLQNLVANSKEAGLEIILIVDESHYHYWSERSQELVQGVIGPKLILEVSATPSVIPTPEEIEQEEAGFVSIRFDDVIAEGMIKIATVINEAIGKFGTFRNTADEVVIEAAVAKRNALQKAYKAAGSEVRPLLLIQLPSDTQATSALDRSKLDEIESVLKEKHGVTVENGKLAVWLSERKENIEEITRNDSPVEALIFKQAIALGWDCPRAQILVMFRDIQVEQFEIQTIGRIMRMPETKHYENESLNQAYVYTNLDRISVAQDGTSEGYFKVYRAVRKDSYKPINLPSVYLSRIEYGDLTLSFRRIFAEEANKYFGISNKDSASKAKDKADVKLDLLPQELTRVVISDAVIKNIDEQSRKEILGSGTVEFSVSADEIKRAYEIFAKVCSLPFAPVRSHTKIQQAIYDWFDKHLGYEKISRLEIQRIVVCSEINQTIFKEIIESAKKRFKEVDTIEKKAKQKKKEYIWNVPEVDYFNERYESVDSHRSILVSSQQPTKVLLNKDRSSQEKKFEDLLESAESVEWWYKNGESQDIYLAIPYLDAVTGFERAFYPDYITVFRDNSVGIFDTKSGFTKESSETASKSDALLAYIDAGKKRKMRGGIVSLESTGWHICTGRPYAVDGIDWERFEL